jgi:hypothetical protein
LENLTKKKKTKICCEQNFNRITHVSLGRGGSAGGKFRISLACPVGAVMNCADNTGKAMKFVQTGSLEI